MCHDRSCRSCRSYPPGQHELSLHPMIPQCEYTCFLADNHIMTWESMIGLRGRLYVFSSIFATQTTTAKRLSSEKMRKRNKTVVLSLDPSHGRGAAEISEAPHISSISRPKHHLREPRFVQPDQYFSAPVLKQTTDKKKSTNR